MSESSGSDEFWDAMHSAEAPFEPAAMARHLAMHLFGYYTALEEAGFDKDQAFMLTAQLQTSIMANQPPSS